MGILRKSRGCKISSLGKLSKLKVMMKMCVIVSEGNQICETA
jgi:hypothetical protein